jgi:hypothetical protein
MDIEDENIDLNMQFVKGLGIKHINRKEMIEENERLRSAVISVIKFNKEIATFDQIYEVMQVEPDCTKENLWKLLSFMGRMKEIELTNEGFTLYET